MYCALRWTRHNNQRPKLDYLSDIATLLRLAYEAGLAQEEIVIHEYVNSEMYGASCTPLFDSEPQARTA